MGSHCGCGGTKQECDEIHVLSSGSHNGVNIERLKHSKFAKSSKVGRIVNFLTFTWRVYRWNKSADETFDVLVSETDPFLLPIAVSRLAKNAGAKYVAYVQDIYPDIPVVMGISRENWVTRVLRDRIRRAYLNAAAIIVLDEDMRDRLAGWGIPYDRFVIHPNWVDTDLIRPVEHSEFRFAIGRRW